MEPRRDDTRRAPAADRNYLPARGIVPRRQRKNRLTGTITVIDDREVILGEEETVNNRARMG